MIRIAIAMFVAGCGGHAASSTTASSHEPPPGSPSPTLATDAPMDCSSTVEDSLPGNADRFAFETPDGRLHGYKNGKGAVVIAPTLRFAYEFNKGGIAAAVDGNGKMVFIDATGKAIAHAYAFDNGPDYFQEGYARIVDDAGKIGFISDHGVITVKPQYDRAEGFCHGVAEVVLGSKTLHIDRLGVSK